MSAYPIPFDQAGFPAIPDMVPPRKSRVSSSLVARAPVQVRGALKVPGTPAAVVNGVWIQEVDGDAKSQSFQNKAPEENEPLDTGDHFHFLPTIDRVEIRWDVSKADRADKAVFEIWSAADPDEAIWTREYAGGEAGNLLKGEEANGKGALDWTEVVIDGDEERFPDRCPNVAHAPYQLRLSVTCKETGAVTTAWTYFDVLVDSIVLHWGPETWIPAAQIPETSAMLWPTTRVDEKTLLKRLKKQQKDSDPAVTAIHQSDPISVRLRSTMGGYISCYEWYGHGHDFAYLRHKARWGAGPRIPMYAQIYLRRVDGTRLDPDAEEETVSWTRAGAALGPARLLWDWHDRSVNDRRDDQNRLNPDAGTFVMNALDYRVNSGDTEPPDCRNCHVDRGGKRGGPERIFPDQPGDQELPFKVTKCATRKWAAFSVAVTSGENACRAGVLFNPSRMAKDTYRITVLLATERAADRAKAAVDAGGKIADLLQQHPGLPEAHTGMVEVMRQIDARYLRKANYAAIDRNMIDAAYQVAGLHIEWLNEADPTFTGYWDKADYDQCLQDAVAMQGINYSSNHEMGKRYSDNGGFNHRNKLYGRIQSLLDTLNTLPQGLNRYDQWFGCAAGQVPPPQANDVCLVFPAKDVVVAHYRDLAVQDYINKNRKINDKKRKWRNLKQANPATPDPQLRVQFYNNTLKASERTKVDAITKTKYEADGWTHFDEANPYSWAVFNYDKGSIDLIMEMCLLKIMNDGYQGVTFFHFINSWETLDANGDGVTRNWGLGGVAKTEMAADLGLKSMFFVWDHPDDGRRAVGLGLGLMMDGNVTAVHEFGHNLHLAHSFSSESKWMHDGTPAERGDDPRQKATAPARQCVMNYHAEDTQLCGVCRLRLRGWGMLKVDNKNIVGFDTTIPANPGQAPETGRFKTLNAFFTDLTA